MGPRKDLKESLYVPASARLSDGDDDDDFEPTPTRTFSRTMVTPMRKAIVPKNPKGNKENKPKQSKLKDGQKLKVLERVNKNASNAIEAQRMRRAHCINYSSCHIIHYLRNITQGSQPLFWQKQSLNTPVLANAEQLRVHRTYLGFSRRVTSLAWHPTNPCVAAVGSKGGDIIVWNFEREGDKPGIFIEGTGANGSIQALKFDEVRPNMMYSVSINGRLTCHDATRGSEFKVLLDTGFCDHWYTSLDLSAAGDVMVAGDNRGNVTLMSISGEQLWTERLHKMKVTHIEFCPRMPWCLVTTSLDRSLKVWDVRNMKTRDTCLHSYSHERPINSSHFSRTDGSRLLTTDQHSEIRVYSCPSFTHSLTIPHPHRQFQYLTPIKATWHPLRDIIVVGRYPDPLFPSGQPLRDYSVTDTLTMSAKEARTIDLFDGATGQLLHQLSDPGCSNKIVSLNMFGHSGDVLLSAAGMCVWVWKPKFSQERTRGTRKGDDLNSDGDSNDDDDDDDDTGTKTTTMERKRSTKQREGEGRRMMMMTVDRR